MDLKSKHAAPVLTDHPKSKSRLGLQTAVSFSSGLHYPITRKMVMGKLDDVRPTSWLDSMNCSSPHKRINKGSSFDFLADENDVAYCSWLLKYPSALTSFKEITSCAQGKRIALFLDYDGTLSLIVNDPDSAVMSSAMRDAVLDAVGYFPTAIISGRCRDKVHEFVGLSHSQLYYAGSHGMDIMGPVTNDDPNCIRSTDKLAKEVNLFQPAREFIPMIDEVFRSLVENTKGIKGAKVENNKFCVSVHYRLVDENNWPTVAECVHEILKEYPRLRLTHGRKVLEVRPVINWDKGKAVEFLLDSLGLSHCDDVLPIYIGDDRTDEDAFKVLREQNKGCGILVSSVPKESNAFYSLRDPTEVMEFLKSLVRWKKTSGV